MTYTGLVISSSGFSSPDPLVYDFAAAALMRAGIAEVKWVGDNIEKYTANPPGALFIVSELAEAEWGSIPDGLFSVSENTRLVSAKGELLGAAVFSPVPSLSAIERQTTVNGGLITPVNYTRVSQRRRAAVRRALAEAGVFVEDEYPAVSPLASVGAGSYIGAGAAVAGSSVIGKRCSVTGASLISDSVIGDGVQIRSAVILQSSVGGGTTVGPFAYIRPGSEVGAGVKVGDFVEVKNSAIGDGTKISHLTYVGDSDVGKKVNFGCGTVTVNYDGIAKHRTVIGDNAFIGCNANLVAPVTVGDNAFIAAGSTITDEIPPKSFAIARQRQTTKENYVEEKMPGMIK